MPGRSCKFNCGCHKENDGCERSLAFLILRCEALRRKLIPQLLIRIQAKDLCILDMSMVCPDCEQSKCYGLGEEPVLLIVLDGPCALPVLHQVVGDERHPGTFLGDFGNCGNLIYVSTSEECVHQDLAHWECSLNVWNPPCGKCKSGGCSFKRHH